MQILILQFQILQHTYFLLKLLNYIYKIQFKLQNRQASGTLQHTPGKALPLDLAGRHPSARHLYAHLLVQILYTPLYYGWLSKHRAPCALTAQHHSKGIYTPSFQDLHSVEAVPTNTRRKRTLLSKCWNGEETLDMRLFSN